MDVFIGEIRIFAGNFAPAGWMLCQGQILSISEYETLFNLIGTTYGGDGLETFALPDLQGRVPIHSGRHPDSGRIFTLGEKNGTETFTLTANQLPSHQHVVSGPVSIAALGANPGNQLTPDNNYPAITSGKNVYSTRVNTGKDTANLPLRMAPLEVTPTVGDTTMMQVQPTGSSQPIDNMQPYLTLNYIISLFGIFPTQ
ncbi:phage tail protein [Chitinophaga sp. RAB17]|uniref:phage tail protein n=1 Tax=Chitinophaga sp. RAB17 TaxID=3233049 RepID=UPI003F90212A